MPEPFKNLYNKKFYDNFLRILTMVKPDLDTELFYKHLWGEDWEKRELKERMRQTTVALYKVLGDDYQKNVSLIITLIAVLRSNGYPNGGLEFIFLPDFLELYGIEDLETSILAIEEVTTFISCEFAVRPFIVKYGQEMIDQMFKWAHHEDLWVRRLATEGCRPRLPWAIALPDLKKDPNPIKPILDQLKNDDSLDVRRSVANNINDISKDNPEWVIELIGDWLGRNSDLDWVCKHGARTLLKAGNGQILKLFGYGDPAVLEFENFSLESKEVSIGGDVHFNFSIKNCSDTDQLLRLEYATYYLKSRGVHSRKVFKISERNIEAGGVLKISRKQHFREVTTRKLYPGEHKIAVIINGEEQESLVFNLK